MKHKICPMSMALIRIGCTAVSKQLIVNHLLFVKYCVILTSFWKSESLSQSLAPMSPVDEIMRHFQLTWLINRPPSRGGTKDGQREDEGIEGKGRPDTQDYFHSSPPPLPLVYHPPPREAWYPGDVSIIRRSPSNNPLSTFKKFHFVCF